MKRKFLTLCLVLVLAVTSLGLTAASHTPAATDLVKSIQSLDIFRATKWEAHNRTPNTDQVETYLEEHGISMTNPQVAVQAFMKEWAKHNPPTPNPKKLQDLLDRERQGLPGPMAASSVTGAKTAVPQIMSLAVPVEFPNSDTFTYSATDPVTSDCVDLQTTQTGPLHNQIPAPGPRDNNTIWYNDTTPTLYNDLYFGVGPDAGVIVQHPNLGTVDLRGDTMANYYLEQSYGTFTPMGEVYPKWLQAAHSEGWYGQNSCATGSRYLKARDLVAEAVDLVNADDPAFAWQTYDGNADGIVDNFTVIHAGMGEEAGGGQQGEFAIWSHAWSIGGATGKLACTMGSAGCPDRDIFVREYSMDPENLDVGVIAEEFGHAAFGLPDIYTTDAQGSPSNWVIFEAGSWNGALGGMQPAPYPLVFRYLVGWAKPLELSYDTVPTIATVAELSNSSFSEPDRDLNMWYHRHAEQGIKINLPDTEINIVNRAGTGQAWWSELGNNLSNTLARSLDLTTATAPVFSFATVWSLEDGWDYGYVQVSTDAGLTWTFLKDTSGFMTDTNPNGNNQGWGLTGEGQGTITFDLTPYIGKVVDLRLLYSTDAAVNMNGWWADDFALVDGATTLFTDAVETPPNGWTANGWVIVPLIKTYPKYYMVEWRNLSGFDKGLTTPYTTIYNNPATTEWQVDRCPYTAPGMLLWLRNSFYGFDYTLLDSIYEPPSYGPKHALLVVDSHYWPLEWEGLGTSEAHLRLNSRCQPGNSTFTVQKTTSFTASRSDAAGNILETKTFEALPAVSQFHDSLGYYPGLRFRPANGGLYFWDAPASLVVPAKGDYTTKITNLDKTPALDLYGINPYGDTVLGSGDPRDNNVQFGLNIAVLSKSKDGSTGRIAVWNATSLVGLKMRVYDDHVYAGEHLAYMLKVQNLGPATQPFSVSDPIPANTTFEGGRFYNAATNSIEWTGMVRPHETKVLVFWVTVDAATPVGTVITNNATLSDDALGSSASATSTVVEHHPHDHD